MTISPEQSRAARGLLDWSQTKLGAHANLSESTIRDFEKGRRVPTINNLAAIRSALETAGVEFIPENGKGPGVRLKKQSPGPARHD
jgi:transcriptional regulator with XRE-family HTH domain